MTYKQSKSIIQGTDKHKSALKSKNSPLNKKDCTCWKGHSRVPGTKPCAPGSCEKNKK